MAHTVHVACRFAVSLHSLKSVDEVQGDWLLHQESWTVLYRRATIQQQVRCLLCCARINRRSTVGALTSSRVLLCMCLNKLSETDSMMVEWGHEILSQSSTKQSYLHHQRKPLAGSPLVLYNTIGSNLLMKIWCVMCPLESFEQCTVMWFQDDHCANKCGDYSTDWKCSVC